MRFHLVIFGDTAMFIYDEKLLYEKQQVQLFGVFIFI